MYVIRVHEVAKSGEASSLQDTFGEFIFFHKVDYSIPKAIVEFCEGVDKAMKFESKLDAIIQYREIHPDYPYRDDGKPNRPLTAFTVEIVGVETIQKEIEKCKAKNIGQA